MFKILLVIDETTLSIEFGERYIDAEYATTSIYKGTTMNGNEMMFGVNFVDGRIKGYPTSKDFEIKLVRGSSNYGINNFVDNGDGTITDNNTDLMWDAQGSTEVMNWQEAFAWVQQKKLENYLGYSAWMLPNAKVLQSIVDYSRSPSHTNSAAISDLFTVPEIIAEGGKQIISGTGHLRPMMMDLIPTKRFTYALGGLLVIGMMFGNMFMVQEHNETILKVEIRMITHMGMVRKMMLLGFKIM